MKNIKFDISFIAIIAIFLIAGIFSWQEYFKVYRQEDTVSIHQFPKVIDGWVSEEIPIEEDAKAILETDNVFVRRYTNADEGKEVYLFIVYSQNNRKVAHPPEICYTGGGATIVKSVHDAFPSSKEGEIKVNRLIAEMGNVRQMFFYWFKVGDAFTSNYWKQQALIALKSFLGQPSSSAMIRISTDVQGGADEAAAERLKEFGALIAPYFQEYLP